MGGHQYFNHTPMTSSSKEYSEYKQTEKNIYCKSCGINYNHPECINNGHFKDCKIGAKNNETIHKKIEKKNI